MCVLLTAMCGLLPADCGLLPTVCGLLPAVCGLLTAVCGILPAVYGHCMPETLQINSLLCCAKSLQLCLTLCDPMDCTLPGSSVHGILHERILAPSAGDLRERPRVPLRGEGSCGGGGAPRDSAGSGATDQAASDGISAGHAVELCKGAGEDPVMTQCGLGGPCRGTPH